MKGFRVLLTTWTVNGTGAVNMKLAEDVTIAAARCCTNSGWVMFYNDRDEIVATWPAWRVLQVTNMEAPIS